MPVIRMRRPATTSAWWCEPASSPACRAGARAPGSPRAARGCRPTSRAVSSRPPRARARARSLRRPRRRSPRRRTRRASAARCRRSPGSCARRRRARRPAAAAALSSAWPSRTECPISSAREMTRPVHLNPATEVAERVLLPGDPQRALAVSQALLDSPRMMNARRGLWGYTGTAADGLPVTVQSTGMGGPSAAIVVEEMIELGARTFIRIGTCGSLVPDLRLGELIAAEAAIPADGASHALGADGRVEPDPLLTEALEARPGIVVSTDLFYDPRPEIHGQWVEAGAQAIEMEAAAVLAVAARREVRGACLLAVTDELADGRVRMDQERIEEIGVELGRVAL